jgi:NAD(P)-dependent dehydrogenase (short-subunit alcohol dehydrogenase family)
MAYKPFDLTGKVALITGGNSGIGLGMAEALASAGADVCIWGTNEEKNAKALETLKPHGGRYIALKCDVSREAQVEDVFGKTLNFFGRVDSCFANAGTGGVGTSIEKTSEEEWRRVLGINLDGAFWTLREASKHMMSRQGGGSLVATASIAALVGNPRSVHYAATKGGLISVIKSFSVAMARYKVRANVILPGWTQTPMTGDSLNLPLIKDRVLTRIPMRRWGQPADFGGIAVYLASDASAYHTGDTFIIDGGYSLF